MEQEERGILYHIVRFLWPVGAFASLVMFLLLCVHGFVYEACVQGAITAMMVYIWPGKGTENNENG